MGERLLPHRGERRRRAHERICGECTVCCNVHEIQALPTPKPAGQWCQHCTIGVGCQIYNERPQVCKDYLCGWRKGVGKEEDRPDKGKIVIDYYPEGLMPGKTVILYEAVQGALASMRGRDISVFFLESDTSVLHIHLFAKKQLLFLPRGKFLSQKLLDAMKESGIELGDTHSLYQVQ